MNMSTLKSIFLNISGSYRIIGLLVAAASLLTALIALQSNNLIVQQLDATTIKSFCFFGAFASFFMFVTLMVSDDESPALEVSNGQPESASAIAAGSEAAAVFKAGSYDSDSGLVRLSDWQAENKIAARQLVIFDLEVNNHFTSNLPVQDVLAILGERLSTFCSVNVGLHAMQADTLSLAIVSEASALDLDLIQTIIELLKAPLAIGLVGVSCRYRTINGAVGVNLREMQLARSLPDVLSPFPKSQHGGGLFTDDAVIAFPADWQGATAANDQRHNPLSVVV